MERIGCPPAYDRLATLCKRAGYWLELSQASGTFELRVVGPEAIADGTPPEAACLSEPIGHRLSELDNAAQRILARVNLP